MATGDWLRFFLAGWGLGFTAYAIAQIAVPWLSHGRYRTWAFLPAPVMLVVVAVTANGYLAQSNLWPIWLIFISPLAFLYLMALGVDAFLHKPATVAPNKNAL
jgi:hypothetical protein